LRSTGGGTGLTSISQDTSPQLGGNLDLNSHDITGAGDVNIAGGATFAPSTGSATLTLKGSGTTSGDETVITENGGALTVQADTSSTWRSDTFQILSSGGVVGLYASPASTTFRWKNNDIWHDGNANTKIDSHLNQANPTSGYVLSWNGTDYAWVAQSGGGAGISNVVEDASPQLGGNLDLNSNDITGTGDIDLTGTITATSGGSVIPFYFANQAAFPSATTYHGAIAHSHADGTMYFAHGGSWERLAKYSEIGSGGSGDITAVNITAGTGLTGSQSTASGDHTQTLSLAAAGIGSGTYGSTSNTTKIDTITVDAYGRVTAVATGAVSSGSGTPGGSSAQVQYNANGSFGGDSTFTFNATTNTLTVENLEVTGSGSTNTISSSSDVVLDAGNRVTVEGAVPFRLPNLTTTERNAISAQAGDMVFNTSTNAVNVYNGSSWVAL